MLIICINNWTLCLNWPFGKRARSSLISVHSRFAKEIQSALKLRYGRVPSAAFVSREFNLRNKDSKSISQEAARNWLRGNSIPSPDRLEVIIKWLGIDTHLIWQECKEPTSSVLVRDPQELLKAVTSIQTQLSAESRLAIIRALLTPPPRNCAKVSPHSNTLAGWVSNRQSSS